MGEELKCPCCGTLVDMKWLHENISGDDEVIKWECENEDCREYFLIYCDDGFEAERIDYE